MGRIHNNNDRANDTQKTANLSHQTETFLEEDTRQNSCNDDRQSSQRCNEDSIGKSVCDKVEDLANDHKNHTCPPPKVLEVSISFSSNLVVFLVGTQ